MDPAWAFLFHFLSLTSPDGQEVNINIDQVVSIRERREDEKHFHHDVQCLIFTSDGKFIGVKESCQVVQDRLDDLYHKGEEEQR